MKSLLRLSFLGLAFAAFVAPLTAAPAAPEDMRFKVEKLLGDIPQPMTTEMGPDGRLYFNVGNDGRQLKKADGSGWVVDKAGNETWGHRKPYQQGLVFRCNPDGSGVETLGWNFRNNYCECPE